MTDYDNADFYDCSDPEQLQHEWPEDAICCYAQEAYSDHGVAYPSVPAGATLTVTAYKRQAVSKAFIQRVAEDALELADEAFEDDFGDPSGNSEAISADEASDARPLFVEAVRKLYSHATVWACDPVGTREYSAAEVETILRGRCPQWFRSGKDGGT